MLFLTLTLSPVDMNIAQALRCAGETPRILCLLGLWLCWRQDTLSLREGGGPQFAIFAASPEMHWLIVVSFISNVLQPSCLVWTVSPSQDYFRSHPAATVLATWCHGLELRPTMWAGEPRGYRTRGKLAVGGGASGIVIGLFKRGTWKVGIISA